MARLGILLVATGLLNACGTATAPSGEDPPSSEDIHVSTAAPVDASGEIVAHGMLIQTDPAGDVEICVGGVDASQPPQCSGPTLEGAFSWDQVESSSQSGVTWTDESYYAVGHFTPAEAYGGTLSLTRPVSVEPPEGYSPPAPMDATFPQLCDDPTGDVTEVDQAARAAGTDGLDEEQALLERTATLDGYVTSWVSGGGAVMNVVVNSDPEGARAALREVFSGPLCVAEQDLPAEEDMRAAQDAVTEEHQELQLLNAGSSTTGRLEISVVVADQATIDRIHELSSPWLTPAQVDIHSALQPLN